MRTARVPALSRTLRSPRALLALALLAGTAALLLLPHPRGVSPIAALALFSGACLRSRAASLALSLGAFALAGVVRGVALGDWEVGFHALAPVVYGSWALCVALGWWLRARRSAPRIAGASVAGSLLFFALTNFAVWASLDTYPPTAAGLAACYAAGLPLLARALLGDLAYAAALFGALAWAERRAPGLRLRPVRV